MNLRKDHYRFFSQWELSFVSPAPSAGVGVRDTGQGRRLGGLSAGLSRPSDGRLFGAVFFISPSRASRWYLELESVEAVALWSIRRLEKGRAALYPRPARSPGS